MPSYKFTYLDIKARGELSRLLMVLGNQKFEDIRIPFSDFAKIKTGYQFGILPLLSVKTDNGSSYELSQSLTISRYLAKKFNFLGKSLEDQAECEMYTDQLNDVMSETFIFFKASDPAKKEEVKKNLIGELLPRNLQYVEDRLIKNKSGFMIGTSLTMVDLMLLVFCENLTFVGLEFPLDKFPNVQACLAKVKSNEKIAEWRKTHP